MIDPHIFRAYDIRGKALTQLTADACHKIGQAFGTKLAEFYGIENPRVVVGRDARTHGPELEEATIAGLRAAGCHVLRIGATPSPINYFTVCTRDLDGGIQVTASHNPAEDNGLKLQTREAEAFAGEELQELRQQIESGAIRTGDGSEEEIDGIAPYHTYLTEHFANIGKGLRIVVDSGNGIAGPAYCQALRNLGCEVIELYTEPDGTFPNHPADPSKWDTLKDLQATVQKEKADCGFAFDGDGDRLGLVDETGVIRTADELLLLLAKDHLSRNSGAPVVFTVSNSGTLQSEVTAWGGRPVMCSVGHSFVEHTMRAEGAKLGGEQSGHFFCAEDYFDFDDALIAAVRLVKIKAEAKKPFSALFAEFPKVYQAQELRPDCADDKKSAVIARVIEHFQKTYPVETMDGARIDFGDGAWAGIRQSNTSPKISIVLEARSPEKLEEIRRIVLEHLRSYPEIDLA